MHLGCMTTLAMGSNGAGVGAGAASLRLQAATGRRMTNGKRKRMVSLLKPSESASRGAACGCACPSPRRLRWPAPEPGPLLRGAQRLRLLSIVDVGGSPVPLDDLAGLVADRFDAEEEPAIGAVRAAQPCLA